MPFGLTASFKIRHVADTIRVLKDKNLLFCSPINLALRLRSLALADPVFMSYFFEAPERSGKQNVFDFSLVDGACEKIDIVASTVLVPTIAFPATLQHASINRDLCDQREY